ncbi:lactate permease [Halteromyces radiatus]|uniref:lactate permease n=1 Tax=Halteromyces radiatus TaxID=101107 RepID=UPI002220F4B1|nr:lactate permease [Halteromyces radiatus]KAI8099691.1 lactate permease [Halteromyces radiatus]
MSTSNIPPIPASAYEEGLFIQELTPIGGSLVGSFFVGLIPLLTVLVMLGGIKAPAHYASAAGLIVCIFIAIFAWHMPAQQCFESIANGIVFANWPIMWIVVNAMFIYNTAVLSGIFDLFRRWMITNTPPDQRVILLIVGFAFGALLEGVAGFGTPGAICSAMMVSLGFDPADALVYTLVFDTVPVAFGALGIPVTTLATLTGLSPLALSAMMGRQLPLMSLFLPSYALLFFAGPRAGLLECWPLALIGGLSFAVIQGIFANLVGPELPDLIAGLVSLFSLIIFVQYWKPPYRPEFAAKVALAEPNTDEESNSTPNRSDNSIDTTGNEKIEVSSTGHLPQQIDNNNNDSNSGNNDNSGNNSVSNNSNNNGSISSRSSVQSNIKNGETTIREVPSPVLLKKTTWLEGAIAWSPWLIIVVVVIIWTFTKASAVGQVSVYWPNLHQRVWLTLYGKKYDAIWSFQPLATGTAILVSSVPFNIIVLLYGGHPRIFLQAIIRTVKQLIFPVFTVSFIMALAYLYNYSGIVYTIGLTLSSVGRAFPFLSAWLGWLACFLSGSDTSANSLFGNLQVVAAREIGLSAVLMASTNSSGAICSKMISPQNLTTGVSTIGLHGKEGVILRRTILHSIGMVCFVGVMCCVQQYGIPGIIPPEDYSRP